MAAQNVCRYHQFGHCKFSDKCRFIHAQERCENPECEIRSCNLRHPRKCKWFRDYRRCKFGEWCSFDHADNNDSKESIKEIFEKLKNLSMIILEKDKMIGRLAEKKKKLEEHLDLSDEQDTNESEIDETSLNTTFQNPYLTKGFPCEMCEFSAKSNSGLQLHMKAKHKHSDIISEEPCEILNLNETHLEIQINCDKCECVTKTKEEMEKHMIEKHDANKGNEVVETIDVKLEIFCLAVNENDVFEKKKFDGEAK